MEQKLHKKRRDVTRIIPWEPYKAATAAHVKGICPSVIPPLIKYEVIKPSGSVSKHVQDLKTTEGIAQENVAPGTNKVIELSRVRPVGNGKESLSLTEKKDALDGQCADDESINELKKNLESERQLTEELKRLLVATMGDDLTCHMQSLSEDKIRLAHAVTKFQAQLTHDHDRAEDLAISSDMWRCKFLAMSIRVDDLRGQQYRLLTYCKQLRTLLNKTLVVLQDQVNQGQNQFLEALKSETRAALLTDLSTFCERSPCDEKTCNPAPLTSNITITCCKHCNGNEIKLI